MMSTGYVRMWCAKSNRTPFTTSCRLPCNLALLLLLLLLLQHLSAMSTYVCVYRYCPSLLCY